MTHQSRCNSRAAIAVLLSVLWTPGQPRAEDGYDLWLRYQPLDEASGELAASASTIVGPASPSPITRAAMDELRRGLSGLTDRPVPSRDSLVSGAIVIGTPLDHPVLSRVDLPVAGLGDAGYLIRSVDIDGAAATVITANEDIGLLYGAFALLRHVQTTGSLAALDIAEAPAIQRRVLNHWDNLDGTVERGYAGESIWDWWRLPELRDRRYIDYARACASIGINGTVLNNVNAQPEILSDRYLRKAAAVADVLRRYGIRVYLSVPFDSPVELGGLPTADPLDPRVRAWWKSTADAIYALIPDFGGFLVKADSEGQPGPHRYGRTHADGANLLAEALRPHGGVVMWRAFVYSEHDPADRVKQAYDEFAPLDGAFADNVLLQVKNGPLDFQPREPFHPLFGAMPRTPLMMELQITKEYLGFSTHLAYLGPLFEEVLDADTFARGEGSTVAEIIAGTLDDRALTGIAGVANIGSDRDWTGSPFDQANWYAFGRLAWDPSRSARAIAEEWLRMTFSSDRRFVEAAAGMMMRSREAVVDYMTPLGLAHLMGTGHHYGPAPWVDDLSRPEWNPSYYHRANRDGIGFDRTSRGSNAVAQYKPPLAERFGSLDTVPEPFLLWFHRLPWDHRLRSGRTLWEGLIAHYDRGVAEVDGMRRTWARLESFVDAERFTRVRSLLAIQAREARWWRDACVAYFQRASGRELPDGVEPPAEPLEHYKALEFPYAPGH